MENFISYLKKERKASQNTIDAYRRDLEDYSAFLKSKGFNTPVTATNTDVVSYIMYLNEQKASQATVARRISSLRSYYKFLMKSGKVRSNPALEIKLPRQERKELIYLTVEEVDALMNLTKEDEKGLRDRALMELMYATGIRVNEAIEARVSDINLKMGFIECSGQYGKARIVPIGKYAKEAITKYLETARPALLKNSEGDSEEDVLFLNYSGKPLSRQGVWKILKAYGRELDIEDRITPHILRNSFAVHMLQNGADPKTVQELMGHEDMQAMQIYLSVTKTRIKDVYDKTHPRA